MIQKRGIEPKKFSRMKGADCRLSRRQFLSMSTVGGGAMLLSACGSIEGQTFQGYSIFYETMAGMAWPKIQQAIDDGAIVLLPVGIIEEHGPHMGLAIDIYQTYNWCKMTRRALEARGIPTLIAPPVYWGVSTFVRNYPGTFSVRDETLANLIYDVHASLKSWGVRYIFNFSAHGDSTHNEVYQKAVQAAHDELDLGAYYVYPVGTKVLDERYALFIENAPTTEAMRAHADIHAGAFETAEMMAYFPKEVDTQIAKGLKPSTGFAPNGYWGDPASFDKISVGEIRTWAEGVTAKTVEAIERFIKEQR